MCGTMPSGPKPYEAQVWRGGKMVYLGTFATAEEAALHVVRSPEGQAAVAAPPPPLLSSEEEDKGKVPAMPTGAVLKEKGAAPPMPPGAYVEEEELALPLPLAKEDALVPPILPDAIATVDDESPPMPSDAVVKHELAVVVKEEESSDGRPKWQRRK